jgi:hypothetical protein
MTQSRSESDLSYISEAEFKRLCDELYEERHQLYSFNPNVSRRDALLWMLAGCLVSLLSVPILEQPSVYGGASADPYADAVRQLLEGRMQPTFDPQPLLAELTRKVEAEE